MFYQTIITYAILNAYSAQSAGAVDYADCISAKGENSPHLRQCVSWI